MYFVWKRLHLLYNTTVLPSGELSHMHLMKKRTPYFVCLSTRYSPFKTCSSIQHNNWYSLNHDNYIFKWFIIKDLPTLLSVLKDLLPFYIYVSQFSLPRSWDIHSTDMNKMCFQNSLGILRDLTLANFHCTLKKNN